MLDFAAADDRIFNAFKTKPDGTIFTATYKRGVLSLNNLEIVPGWGQIDRVETEFISTFERIVNFAIKVPDLILGGNPTEPKFDDRIIFLGTTFEVIKPIFDKDVLGNLFIVITKELF